MIPQHVPTVAHKHDNHVACIHTWNIAAIPTMLSTPAAIGSTERVSHNKCMSCFTAWTALGSPERVSACVIWTSNAMVYRLMDKAPPSTSASASTNEHVTEHMTQPGP